MDCLARSEDECMGLNTADFVVIAAYLAAVTLFGLRFRGKERTLRAYFLASNQIPWWAISISMGLKTFFIPDVESAQLLNHGVY